ncbi:MAG: hypothetical protein HQK89_12545 [Nitrospirae bacterium]|nr:hypothetical protein [Nitrospirota bacterium]
MPVIEERVKYEVQYIFSIKMANLPYMEIIFFPEKSIQVADRAVLTFVVLSQYATGNGLKLTLKVEIDSSEGVSKQKVEDTKVALKEPGLDNKIDTE